MMQKQLRNNKDVDVKDVKLSYLYFYPGISTYTSTTTSTSSTSTDTPKITSSLTDTPKTHNYTVYHNNIAIAGMNMSMTPTRRRRNDTAKSSLACVSSLRRSTLTKGISYYNTSTTSTNKSSISTLAPKQQSTCTKPSPQSQLSSLEKAAAAAGKNGNIHCSIDDTNTCTTYANTNTNTNSSFCYDDDLSSSLSSSLNINYIIRDSNNNSDFKIDDDDIIERKSYASALSSSSSTVVPSPARARAQKTHWKQFPKVEEEKTSFPPLADEGSLSVSLVLPFPVVQEVSPTPTTALAPTFSNTVRTNEYCPIIPKDDTHHNKKSQKFRDDKTKKKKIKTELCTLFNGTDGSCPFGKNCNYAHNEAELEKKYMFERKDAGLIHDVKNYRVKPCFDFVSTGDCPMQIRCSCLHDPRIQSLIPSWLHRSTTASCKLIQSSNNEECKESDSYSFTSPTTTTTSTASASSVSSVSSNPCLYQHVDWNCFQKLSHDNYGHPFGMKFIPNANEYTFDEFYNQIINKDEKILSRTATAIANGTTTFAKNNLDHLLSDSQMLQIVNSLRHSYTKARALHCYRHTHKLYDARVCMLIQTKAFAIASSSVREIPLGGINNDNKGQPIVVVHEIMFEPTEEEPENVFLLFTEINSQNNISSSNSSCTTSMSLTDHFLQELSVKEAKDVKKLKRKLERNVLPSSLTKFHLCYPKDEDAHNLVTDMLLHHSKSFSICDINDIEEMVTGLLSYNSLEQKFHALMNHFALFHWPVNQGYETIDWLTLVPKVDTEYHPLFVTDEGTGFGTLDSSSSTSMNLVAEVWKSFHDTLFPYNATSTNCSTRLQVFTDLLQKSLKNDESKEDLPKIKTQGMPPGLSSENVTYFSEEEVFHWKKMKDYCDEKKNTQLKI